MLKIRSIAVVALASAGLVVGSVGADAKECFKKAAEGTNTTEKGAQFQAFEAILQATSWGLWAAWMANGSTPGYTVDKARYKCTKGTGLGYTCVGSTRICKL